MLKINTLHENTHIKSLCHEFIHSNRPKYIFGRNAWAESIAKLIEVDGFIDNYKIYLRHYTQGISQTIMFFIPINKVS